MNNFDPNYFGHEFSKDDRLFLNLQGYNCFVCSKCNVVIHYEETADYWIFRDGWTKFNLTCDEYIIKSIIE